jgi:hypothetical protein
MKDITVLLYWTNMREIISYWFDVLRETTSYWINVQKRANFKQLFCATCRFPHSYLTYVQFAAGIMSYFLFDGIKLWNTLIISCLVSIVKYNNTSYCLIQVDTNAGFTVSATFTMEISIHLMYIKLLIIIDKYLSWQDIFGYSGISVHEHFEG